MRARWAPARRARDADRVSAGHEVARSFPMTEVARGQRSLEAGVAHLAVLSMGSSSDRAHPAAHRALALGPRSAHRAERSSGGVASIDHLDQAARSTRHGQLSPSAVLTHPAFFGGGERKVRPSTTYTSRFWKVDPPRPQGDNESADRRRCSDQQGSRSSAKCTPDRAQGGRTRRRFSDHLGHHCMCGPTGDAQHRIDHR